jgi:hypothetical protein
LEEEFSEKMSRRKKLEERRKEDGKQSGRDGMEHGLCLTY